ncbi:MAG: choice-of-anchor D domain-containing protein [Candidatus Marinimicrobia bacterium]|nr:choice-of-anchor D domain-containing protein [Candidatus Neomarinimicrobiota bacterium]MCF7840073.1 choice-of-anchor D domain-containing protein [Candidatus Neomarinimicrobiota bacterium]MCF7902672.1 choice-of-anchor D domain-containing protein [Candidatus Neomarinimicrobiota bacterium]
MKHLLSILGILLIASSLFAQQVRDTVTVDDSNVDLFESYTTYDFWDVVNVGFNGQHHVLLRSGGNDGPTGAWTKWTLDVPQSGYYMTYFYLPVNSNSRNRALYVVSPFGGTPDSLRFNQSVQGGYWRPLGIYYFIEGSESFIQMIDDSVSTTGYAVRSDAVRIVRSVGAPDLEPERRNEYNYAEVNIGWYEDLTVDIYNIGDEPLTIDSLFTDTNNFSVPAPGTPYVIPAQTKGEITIRFSPTSEQVVRDTVRISSDDPGEPLVSIPVTGEGTALTVVLNNDNGAPGYVELQGAWTNSNGIAVCDGIPNATSRYSIQSVNPGARAQFNPDIPESGQYNVYYAGPLTDNASDHALVEVYPFGSPSPDSVYINQNVASACLWKFIGTYYFIEGNLNYVFMVNDGTGSGYVLRTDLMKFVSVPARPKIEIPQASVNFGEVSVDTDANTNLVINNIGSQELVVNSLDLESDVFTINSPTSFPVSVPALDSLNVNITFHPVQVRGYSDTLTINSNDWDFPVITRRLYGTGIGEQLYVDHPATESEPHPNWSSSPELSFEPYPGDSLAQLDTTLYNYWYFSSSAVGYNGSHLYLFSARNPDAWVEWSLIMQNTMEYDVYAYSIASEIDADAVPYIVKPFTEDPDTVIVDQASNSGWILLGRYPFIGGLANTVTLLNDTNYTLAGGQSTLRADAIMVQEPFVGIKDEFEPIPMDFQLSQNYPNPFNPTTTIDFTIPYQSNVSLTIYNLLGQRVTTLVSGNMPTGRYSVSWNGIDAMGKSVASGMYFYQLSTPNGNLTKKLLFLK